MAPLGTIVLLVIALGAVHAVSQFIRNSIGVIAPDLARDIGLGAAGIGLLSSVFFLVFAGAQIPVGVAIDRWGPRLIMLISTAVAVLGMAIFAIASSPELLVFGRALIGLGCSSFFMGPLTVYSRWFPPERFSTLVGIQLSISGLGVLGATAPLAYSTEAIGWRMSFLVVAAITALAGLLVYAVARDDPPGGTARERTHETLRDGFVGLMEVVKIPSFTSIFAMHFACYSAFITILGLWGGPYLAHVHGYDLQQRGEMLLVLAIVNLLASLLWGPTDRLFRSYKRPVIIGAVATVILLVWLAIADIPDGITLFAWFVAFGLVGSFIPVVMAHGRSLLPSEYVGRGLSLMNLGTMGGVFVLQALTGAVVGWFDAPGGVYPLEAYRAAFATQALVLAIAVLIYLGARDPVREANGQRV